VSEGVKILISADDQASGVLAKVSDNVDAKIKQIKTVGQGAKASTEFIGTLANSLGGSVLGSYAQGIAQVTERISAFSEVSKAGAGGAMAFKAGLAGVALVAGFKIGTMIGDWAFETARWNKELEKANESLKKSASMAANTTGIGLSIKTEKIEQTDDPVERAKLLRQYQTELSKEAEKTASELAKQTKELKDQQTWYQRTFGISAEQKAMDEADLALNKEKLATIEKEQEVVRNKLRSDVLELEAVKEANALKKRNDSYIAGLADEVALLKASKDEHAAIEAMQRADGDPGAAARIEALLREKDAIEAKKIAEKEAADEAKRKASEQQADTKRIADLKEKELTSLKQQRIELEQGKTAAHAFALEQQGLDKATADRIASEQESLDKQKAMSGAKAPDLQAVQSRLLTRGPVEKGMDKVAKNTEKTALTLEEIKLAWLAQTSQPKIEFVGVN